MFESVARGHPQLREYLSEELSKKIEVLVLNPDVEQLRRAQGHAQALREIITALDMHLLPSRARAVSST
jgi:NAD(P)H-dependent FMN reductase